MHSTRISHPLTFDATCYTTTCTPGSCYSNRAACWLAIGELDKCVEDCTETLDMLPAPADLAKMMQAPDPHPDQVQWHRLCCKVLVRRGTALCRLGKYEKALENYQVGVVGSRAQGLGPPHHL